MAFPTTAELRAALKTNLDAIPDVQASAYMLGNPTPPCVWVKPYETDFDETMQRGTDLRKFVVEAYMGLVTDVGAQKILDQMLDSSGSYSVKAAIETDKTLGGLVGSQATHVTKQSGYQIYDSPNVGTGMGHGKVLAAEWEVEIYVEAS